MEASERLQEIRLKHGRHTGRKCEVCWMLQEVGRRDTEPRVVAAEETARIAAKAMQTALDDANMWRENVQDMTERLVGNQHAALLARDAAARELATSTARVDAISRQFDDTCDRFKKLRLDVEDAVVAMRLLPSTPRTKAVKAVLEAALTDSMR